MWKRLFKIKRYFFVSFAHSKGFGNCSVYTTEGNFPNMEILKKLESFEGLVILNIIEITKRDFNDLYKKP